MNVCRRILIILFIICLFALTVCPLKTNAQITDSYGQGYYGKDSSLNYYSFDLTMFSPNNQTTYNNTLSLDFNITWTKYPMFPFPKPINGYYAYSIDNGSFVNISPTPSSSDHVIGSSEVNFLVNPSFSYVVPISNLTEGYHNIVINASLYLYNDYPPKDLQFTMITTPYVFSVGEPTATPITKTTSTFMVDTVDSLLAIIAIAILAVFIVIALSLVLHRRHRTKNLPDSD